MIMGRSSANENNKVKYGAKVLNFSSKLATRM